MEQSAISAFANAPVFETLLSFSSDLALQPRLAVAWEHRPPNTWRFWLREGVRFHNGLGFDADVVAAVVNGWGGGRNLMALGSGSAVVVDRQTVDITPVRPNFRLPQQLAHPGRRLTAPGTDPGLGTAPANTPTGTGPFRFVRYHPGVGAMVERFPGYWGAPSALDAITFHFFRNDDMRLAALRAGRVDGVYDVPRHRTPEVAAIARLRVLAADVGMSCALLLNHRGAPPYDTLTDERVRRAVALAVDRQEIVAAWRGNAALEQTIVPADVLARWAGRVRGHPYDPEEAGRLLDGAGWRRRRDGSRARDGRSLRLTMLVYSADEQRPAPDLIAGHLGRVGIDVEILAPDPHAYGERLRRGEGDLFASVGNQADANPLFLASLFTGVSPGGVAAYGERFGPGRPVDDLVLDAYATPAPGEARRLTAEAMRVVVDDAVTAVPIAGLSRIYGLHQGVQGFTAHRAKGAQSWQGVSLDSPDRANDTRPER